MNRILIRDLGFDDCFLWGATLGQTLAKRIAELISSDRPALLVLSFAGVEAINGSFVKAGLIPLLMGNAMPGPECSSSICLADLEPDVADEIREILHQRRLAVSVLHTEATPSIEVIGYTDEGLLQTLKLLEEAGEATAPELALSTNETIGATGWNNRLSELYRLGLVKRKRQGRAWKYRSLTQEIN